MYELNETQLEFVSGGYATMIIENYKPSYIVTGDSVYEMKSTDSNNSGSLFLYSNRVEDAHGVTVFSGTGDAFSHNGMRYIACPIDGGNRYSILF